MIQRYIYHLEEDVEVCKSSDVAELEQEHAEMLECLKQYRSYLKHTLKDDEYLMAEYLIEKIEGKQ